MLTVVSLESVSVALKKKFHVVGLLAFLTSDDVVAGLNPTEVEFHPSTIQYFVA